VSAPTFESDKDTLVRVGSTVCHIIVEFDNTCTTNVGMAFFIDTDHLVTAGHNLKRPEGYAIKSVHVISPGEPYINYDKLLEGVCPSLECTVIANLYTGSYGTDIALIRVPKCYKGPAAVEVLMEPPPIGSTVDVIGYPGDSSKNPHWLKDKKPELVSIERGLETIQKLLPSQKLAISRGTVQECTETLVKYKLSTVPGMSGSCVLHQGKLIGKFSPQRSDLILGVHIGETGSCPSALSFIGQTVMDLFQDKEILLNGRNRQSCMLS